MSIYYIMIKLEKDDDDKTTLITNDININENIPDTKFTDYELYVLDPLTVIIKLAILGNKPIGTKIHIANNVIYFQEPGPFQALCRYVLNVNKASVHFLYNPIQIACEQYLNKKSINDTPKLLNLFICAQKGIQNLSETYKSHAIIKICLNYFYVIIDNYVKKIYNNEIFKKDGMTMYYDVNKINSAWTEEKIKIVLDLIDFLMINNNPSHYVKSLETIIDNIDNKI